MFKLEQRALLYVECFLKTVEPAARLNKQLPPEAMVNAILAGHVQRMKLVGMTPGAGWLI